MRRVFKGRVVTPGETTAPALVSHGGLNTLASYQMALMFGDKQVKCGDQNNPDLYKKPMLGKALCLPETIGSTTGGMVLYTACAMGKQPACLLFSKPIDSLAASGAILAAIWTDAVMPVVDQLGQEFLDYMRDGRTVSVAADGTVTVDDGGEGKKKKKRSMRRCLPHGGSGTWRSKTASSCVLWAGHLSLAGWSPTTSTRRRPGSSWSGPATTRD